jgi:hypothetical protein
VIGDAENKYAYYIYDADASVKLTSTGGWVSPKSEEEFAHEVMLEAIGENNSVEIDQVYEATKAGILNGDFTVTSHALTNSSISSGSQAFPAWIVFDREEPQLTSPTIEAISDNIVKKVDATTYQVYLTPGSIVTVSGIVTDNVTIYSDKITTGAIGLYYTKDDDATNISINNEPTNAAIGSYEFEQGFNLPGIYKIFTTDAALNGGLTPMLTVSVGAIGEPVGDLYAGGGYFDMAPKAVHSGKISDKQFYIYKGGNVVTVSGAGVYDGLEIARDDDTFEGSKILSFDKDNTTASLSALRVRKDCVVTRHALTNAPTYFLFDTTSPNAIGDFEATVSGTNDEYVSPSVGEPKYVYLNFWKGTKGVTISGIVSDTALKVEGDEVTSGALTIYYSLNGGSSEQVATASAMSSNEFTSEFEFNCTRPGVYKVWVQDASGYGSD